MQKRHDMKSIERKRYLSQLIDWRDKQVIKVVTGVRRSGKSTLLLQFQEMLKAEGVDESQIQSINFEDMAYEHLLDYKALHSHLVEHLRPDVQNYIFLDEVQMVEEYQRVVDSLQLRPNVDIYITGSNAYLLSGEIATLLSGRYVEISIMPLSFAEFYEAVGGQREDAYRRYISETSFPYALQLPHANAVTEYLRGLYSTVVLKDIVGRRKLSDTDLLEKIVRFLADSVGSLVSVRSIVNNLQAGGRKVSDHTVEVYMQAVVECYLFYKVGRYDIRGKQNLKVGSKYYIVDLGLKNMLLGIRDNDLGHLLECVVYLELVRRGGQVMIGKMGEEEIDFVTISAGQRCYYQVALTVRDEATLERELRPLKGVKDHFQKYLLTMDNDPDVSHNGITQRYALDWLLATPE